MALFGSKKKSLQVSLEARKKSTTPLPPLIKDSSQRRLFKNGRKTTFILLLSAAFGILVFSFSQSLEMFASRVKTNLGISSQSPTQSPLEIVVSEVKKQYLVPEGETPTLAVITDLEELRGQPFFAKAQIGDAVLMYLVAKKGILWRPSTHQVIEVGPISITPPPSVTPAEATSTATSS